MTSWTFTHLVISVGQPLLLKYTVDVKFNLSFYTVLSFIPNVYRVTVICVCSSFFSSVLLILIHSFISSSVLLDFILFILFHIFSVSSSTFLHTAILCNIISHHSVLFPVTLAYSVLPLTINHTMIYFGCSCTSPDYNIPPNVLRAGEWTDVPSNTVCVCVYEGSMLLCMYGHVCMQRAQLHCGSFHSVMII